MPQTEFERENEAAAEDAAKAAHDEFEKEKAAGTLPEGADDPDPECAG